MSHPGVTLHLASLAGLCSSPSVLACCIFGYIFFAECTFVHHSHNARWRLKSGEGLLLPAVVNKVTKRLEEVAAYLDDVIVSDSDPTAHVKTVRALFKRLRKHNLKLSPSKARLGDTGADFMGHSISPAGVRQNAEMVPA